MILNENGKKLYLQIKDSIEILSKTDFVISLSENYVPGYEHSRNRYMVENSTRIIGFYNGLSGGTAHCWNLAIKNNLETVNLYESKF